MNDPPCQRDDLDERAYAYWDPAHPEWERVLERTRPIMAMVQRHERPTESGWTVEPGHYDLVIASSIAVIDHTITVTLARAAPRRRPGPRP